MGYVPKDGFPYYFDLAGDMDCKLLFSSSSNLAFLDTIDEKKASYRYAPDKWSIKQVVGHMADHERIKIYRAFLLSRNQPGELWSYDQLSLVENARFDALPFQQLKNDLLTVRKASHSFVDTLSKEQLKIKGMAGAYEITLEDFLRSIIGHGVHHINMIKQRYM